MKDYALWIYFLVISNNIECKKQNIYFFPNYFLKNKSIECNEPIGL